MKFDVGFCIKCVFYANNVLRINIQQAKVRRPKSLAHSSSFHAQVSSHDPLESIHELLIGGGVAEGVDGAVEIADEVGEHVDVDVDARRAEAVGELTILYYSII